MSPWSLGLVGTLLAMVSPVSAMAEKVPVVLSMEISEAEVKLAVPEAEMMKLLSRSVVEISMEFRPKNEAVSLATKLISSVAV